MKRALSSDIGRIAQKEVKMSEQLKQFPDGTPVDPWFYDQTVPAAGEGAVYPVNENGISADGSLQTQKIQELIDSVSAQGGGTIVISGGTYLTGPLYFKQGVHLRVDAGGVLKGSDDIRDYPLCETRIEGESCLYYPALINAAGLDGFSITGEGTLGGHCAGKRAQREDHHRGLRVRLLPRLSNLRIGERPQPEHHYAKDQGFHRL